MQPYNPVIPGCTFSQDYLMVAWHVSTKMVGKQRVSVVNTLLLSPTALVVAFQWCAFTFNDSKLLEKLFARIKCNTNTGRLPYLETFTWQNLTPTERVSRSGRQGNPPEWFNPTIIKTWSNWNETDYIDRQVTPPNGVSYLGSPTSM